MDKELKQQLKKIRKSLNSIKSDVDSNKEGIQSLQFDLKSVKSDVASNKESIQGMKEDLKSVKSDVGVNKTNIQEGFKKAEKERADLRKRINKTYNSVDGFTKTVDKFEDEFTFFKKDPDKVKDVVEEKHGVNLA